MRDGDVLLLKGSHGSRIHELVETLKDASDGQAVENAHGDFGPAREAASPHKPARDDSSHTSGALHPADGPAPGHDSHASRRAVAALASAAARGVEPAEGKTKSYRRPFLQAPLQQAR